jgi:hypothetical protein
MDDLLVFWILHKNSGICLFEQKFATMSETFETDLVGGFLIAILGFSEEIVSQEVDYVQLQDLRICYNISDDFVMALITNNNIEPEKANGMLNHVQKKFQEKYQTQIQNKFFSDVTPFRSFATEVEKIFKVETKYVSYFKNRSENLQDYFACAEDNMSKIQTLMKKSEGFGNWLTKEKITLDSTIKEDAIAFRSKHNAKNTVKKAQKPYSWV